MIEEAMSYLKENGSLKYFCPDITLGTLRNRTVRWIVLANREINKPEIVKEVCQVPISSLSVESDVIHLGMASC